MLTARWPTAPRETTATRTVLLTGFDAFGPDRGAQSPLNPSALAVQALNGQRWAGHRVVAAVLPTVFATAATELLRLVALHRPVLVVCVGQAGGRAALSIERVAVNRVDAHLPDNAGTQPRGEYVIPGAPASYDSTLPIQAMLAAIEAQDLPGELSSSAGSFVCNHVFFSLMHALATTPQWQPVRAGFVHVPYLPEQGSPHMALADTVRGLGAAVAAALQSSTTTAPLTQHQAFSGL